MKTKITLALVAILTGTAFGSMPAVLPEFKTAKQLAEWRAEMADKANATPSTSDVRSSALDVPAAFYTGKPYVESSGGYAFKYRSYNPELARWTSEDPSGFPDGANNAIYAGCPLSGFDPDGLAWTDIDFIKHYYEGNGKSVNLETIGLLDGVKTAAENNPAGGAFKFDLQIESTIDAIQKPYNGRIEDSFNNTYSFKSVLFSLGSGVLVGGFLGEMTSNQYTDGRSGGVYSYYGIGSIRYNDSFTDPTSVIEYLYGSSTGGPSWLRELANLGGTPFEITGKWDMMFDGGLHVKQGSGTYE